MVELLLARLSTSGTGKTVGKWGEVTKPWHISAI